jgi:hypothetical protein
MMFVGIDGGLTLCDAHSLYLQTDSVSCSGERRINRQPAEHNQVGDRMP